MRVQGRRLTDSWWVIARGAVQVESGEAVGERESTRAEVMRRVEECRIGVRERA